MNKIQTRSSGTYEVDRIEVGERAADALAAPPEKTPKSVTDALEYARAYQQLATFLAANPDLAAAAYVYLAPYTNIATTTGDAVAYIVEAARRGREFGVPVEEWSDGKHGGVKICFGPLYIKVYAEVSRVCRRVVVGVIEDVQYALAFDLDGTPRKVAEVPA